MVELLDGFAFLTCPSPALFKTARASRQLLQHTISPRDIASGALQLELCFVFAPRSSQDACPDVRARSCLRGPGSRPTDLRHCECGFHSLPRLVRRVGIADGSAQWSTTWDRSKLFTYTNLSPNPVTFGSPGAIGQADIVVTDTSTFQSVWGFGATLSTLRCHASAS